MSSTSRSSDGKKADAAEPSGATEKDKKRPSPGRYSLADEDEVPPQRIDSTTRLPAVRPPSDSSPESAAASSGQRPPPSVPRDSGASAPSRPQAGGLSALAGFVQRAKDAAPSSVPQPSSSRDGAKSKGGTPLARIAPSAPKPPVPSAKPAADPTPKKREKKSSAPPKRASVLPPAAAPRKTSSLRPPPPPKGREKDVAAQKPESIVPDSLITEDDLGADVLAALDGFDEGSIAHAFDALVSEGATGEPGKHDFDYGPVRELFAELAANHMRHVRDFMIDVKWGEVTRDWIQICLPPVRTLAKAADRLELPELAEALKILGAELEIANSAGGHTLDAKEKQNLLDAYGLLVDILPSAFALDRDKNQREAVIVQALLLQVPDVRKVTIDKLHAAGLTSLSVLFDANANDIAHVADIPHQLASRIVERMQAYRQELQTSSPQDARAAERDKLAALNGQLKDAHEAYEKAHGGWGDEAKKLKRDCFKRREETWLEISVLLARFGDVERLAGIEKVPFSVRIAQLADYIEEARDKYRAAEG